MTMPDKIDALRRRCETAAAEKLAREALEELPDDVDVMIALGRVQLAAHRHAEAVATFSDACERSPGDPRPVAWKVASLSRSRRFTDAIEAGTEAMARFPDQHLVRIAVGRTFLACSREEEALAYFADAAVVAPDDWRALVWHAIGLAEVYRWTESEDLAAEIQRRHGGEVGVYYRLGRLLIQSGKPVLAVSCFDKAIELDRYFDHVHEWRVTALRQLRRHDEAELSVVTAIELMPGSARLQMELASTLHSQGREVEALSVVERALEIAPLNLWALRSRVSQLRIARRFPEAELAVRQALLLRPDEPDTYVTSAWVFGDQGRQEEAVSAVERALELDPLDSSALLTRVNLLRTFLRFAEAEDAAADAVRLRPGDPDLYVAQASVFGDLDRVDESIAVIEHALRLDPRNSAVLWQRIGFLRRSNRLDEAERAVIEAMEVRPEAVSVHVAAAWVFNEQERPEDALSAVERALELDPRNAWALQSRVSLLRIARRFTEAGAAASEAVRLRPDVPELYVDQAWVLSNQDREGEAVLAVERALRLEPRNVWALQSRIDFLRYARRFDEAEQAAAEAIEALPQALSLHMAAALVFSAQDREGEAVLAVERALRLEPRNARALRSRIDFLKYARRFDEAEQAAAEAVDLRPEDPEIHVAAAWLFDVLDRVNEAIAAADRALTIDPESSSASECRVSLLQSAGRFSEAEQAAGQALRRNPDDPVLHLSAAWVFSDQGRYAEAVAAAECALRLRPEDSWVLQSHVSLLRVARRFREAEEAAANAVRLRPNDPDIYLDQAWVFSNQDREDEAVSAVEIALKADPIHLPSIRARISFLRFARRFAEAERAVSEALELKKDDPYLHTVHGWLFSDLGRYDEAVAAAERALLHDPRNSWALRSRIDFLRFARRLPEAERAAAEAVKIKVRDPAVHVTAGNLAVFLDRHEKALPSFDKATDLDEFHVGAKTARITTLIGLHRAQESEEYAKASVVQHPSSAALAIEMGRVYDYNLAFDSAVECFASALQREPDNVWLHLARSATFRSLRRYGEAEHEIERLFRLYPHVIDLKVEMGWIHHDERRLSEARRIFVELLDSAVDNYERATARHARGWVEFADGKFAEAEEEFRAALAEQPEDFDYLLALAWSLTRQNGGKQWREAEEIAAALLRRRPATSAHVCLGVLAFKQGKAASAEYHLKRALAIDPSHGSHTDLGSLYIQMGRYDEAEEQLTKAIKRDWFDATAHVELGALFLHLDDDHLPAATREFRQALSIDPSFGAAAIGLAQTLAKSGDEVEAESTLRRALLRADVSQKWQSHLALARLLVQRGDKQQNADLHAEAYSEAQRAIGLAPDAEADPHFVASVAHHRMGSLAADARGRFGFRRRAMNHLRECLKRDPGHSEAQRNKLLLEREMKAVAPAVWGGYAVAGISLVLLGVEWVTFFFFDKVTTLMLTATTPVLVGLFTIAVLLPALIRLKLPGFEADLQAGSGAITPGPTGQVTFGPGRFTVTTGPTGQLPRHE